MSDLDHRIKSTKVVQKTIDISEDFLSKLDDLIKGTIHNSFSTIASNNSDNIKKAALVSVLTAANVAYLKGVLTQDQINALADLGVKTVDRTSQEIADLTK